MNNGVFQKWSDRIAPKVIKALQERQFEAYYCSAKSEVVGKVLELIPAGSTVSWGGSVSLEELKLAEEVKAAGFNVIDRDTATSAEERQSLMRDAFFADVYLTSTNALSEDGILVNIDGTGNRVAAMCYGPKSVIVVVGMNKLCKTQEDAVSRARNYAAPMNAARLPIENTICAKKGACGDCKSAECVCSYIVTTRFSRIAKRIKVILVGESLGY